MEEVQMIINKMLFDTITWQGLRADPCFLYAK